MVSNKSLSPPLETLLRLLRRTRRGHVTEPRFTFYESRVTGMRCVWIHASARVSARKHTGPPCVLPAALYTRPFPALGESATDLEHLDLKVKAPVGRDPPGGKPAAASTQGTHKESALAIGEGDQGGRRFVPFLRAISLVRRDVKLAHLAERHAQAALQACQV